MQYRPSDHEVECRAYAPNARFVERYPKNYSRLPDAHGEIKGKPWKVLKRTVDEYRPATKAS